MLVWLGLHLTTGSAVAAGSRPKRAVGDGNSRCAEYSDALLLQLELRDESVAWLVIHGLSLRLLV